MRVAASILAIAITATPAAAAPWWANPANWFVSRNGPTTGGAFTSPRFVRSSETAGLGRWGQKMQRGVNSNDARQIETDAFYATPTEERPDPRITGFRAVLKDAQDEDFAVVRVFDADTGARLGHQRLAYIGHEANRGRQRISVNFGEVRGIVVKVATGNGAGSKHNGNGITIARAHTVQVQNCAPTRAAAMAGQGRGDAGKRSRR